MFWGFLTGLFALVFTGNPLVALGAFIVVGLIFRKGS